MRKLGFLYRSQWDAAEKNGEHVRFGTLLALSVFAVGFSASGTDRAALWQTAVGIAAVWLVFSVWALFEVVRRPEKSRNWRVANHGGSIGAGGLLPLQLMPEGPPSARAARRQYVCKVIDDDGCVWVSGEPSRHPGTWRAYPEDFPGAPPLRDGKYDVMWFEQRWRLLKPLLSYPQVITIAWLGTLAAGVRLATRPWLYRLAVDTKQRNGSPPGASRRADRVAWFGAIVGALALVVALFAAGWSVYTWRTERRTHLEIDVYPGTISPRVAGLIVRARNLSDHPVAIDRVRLEYSYGRVIREVILSGAKVPGGKYTPIPGTIPAHAAGATYLTEKDAAREGVPFKWGERRRL
jgi:hypothetical protein